MTTFKPTFLYLKQHSITGKRYFGKTSRSEHDLLNNYHGSGVYWNNHINKHGKEHVMTVWYELFTEQSDIVDFATFFSESEDIVNSLRYANSTPEDGLNGWAIGNTLGLLHKDKLKGPQTVEHREKLSKANKDKPQGPQTAEHSRKISESKKDIPQKQVVCPHCSKSGGISMMYRWHFDNCKLRK